MKASVRISRGVESLFGTRDENIRLLESGLGVHAQLVDDNLEIEGEAASVARAESILQDYAALLREGHAFNNGDLNSYLRVVTSDPEVSLRTLVQSGKQRNFGKKILAPKSVNQRRYLEAIERNDLVFGIGPAGTGKTYLAVAMGISALMNKQVARIILTRPAVAGERLGFLPGTLQEKVDPYLRPLYDALYDMLDNERGEAARAQRDRSGAHRLYARPYAERQLHHPGRGAEQHAGADEDGAHPPGVQLQNGGQWRRHPDRSAERPPQRVD